MDSKSQHRLVVVVFVGLALVWACGDAAARPDPDQAKDAAQIGKELFTREWLPNDTRSHAGNGLGPVFNARSCVACHNQGGNGGAGPKESNATFVGAIIVSGDRHEKLDRAKLAEFHPALRTEGSFPLHRFSIEHGFEEWKTEKLGSMGRDFHGFGFGGGQFGGIGGGGMLGSIGGAEPLGIGGAVRSVGNITVRLVQSERNTPGLFGAGLIDRIPDQVLKEVAAEQAMAAGTSAKISKNNKPSSPRMNHFGFDNSSLPVSGRVSLLNEGKIGRFGWKSNMATLREFTLQACANEVGLEVPGFARAAPAWIANYKAPGIDLTSQQCDCLIQFLLRRSHDL